MRNNMDVSFFVSEPHWFSAPLGTGNAKAWGLQHGVAKVTSSKRGTGYQTQLLQEKDTWRKLFCIIQSLRKSLSDVKLREHRNVKMSPAYYYDRSI